MPIGIHEKGYWEHSVVIGRVVEVRMLEQSVGGGFIGAWLRIDAPGRFAVFLSGASFLSYLEAQIRVDVFVEVHGSVSRRYAGSLDACSLVVLDPERLERVDGGVFRPGWGGFLRPELALSRKLLTETFVESMDSEEYERSIHEVLDSEEEVFKL